MYKFPVGMGGTDRRKVGYRDGCAQFRSSTCQICRPRVSRRVFEEPEKVPPLSYTAIGHQSEVSQLV